MIRKYHSHTLQTNTRYREEKPQNTDIQNLPRKHAYMGSATRLHMGHIWAIQMGPTMDVILPASIHPWSYIAFI